MAVKVQLLGAKELDKLFKALPKALQDDAIGDANMRAAKPLIEKEKALAPEGPTGNLVDSIGAYRVSKKSARVAGLVIAGPRRRGRYKGFAGHLVEFGTKKRDTNGPNRGVMPKEPFVKPAFQLTRNEIEKRIETELSKTVVKTMKKYVGMRFKAAAA